jgi:polyhydroxyalkanoate synthesis regulator phasin
VEKKSNEMVKEIKSGAGGHTLSDSHIDDKIEDRVERMMQRHQGETTRAINELRRIVSSFKDGQHY